MSSVPVTPSKKIETVARAKTRTSRRAMQFSSSEIDTNLKRISSPYMYKYFHIANKSGKVQKKRGKEFGFQISDFIAL